MKTLGNIIWVIFGGLEIAVEYFFAGIIMMLTIIGIPFGWQSMKMGLLALWPFGSRIQETSSQTGCLNLFMNILWFIGISRSLICSRIFASQMNGKPR